MKKLIILVSLLLISLSLIGCSITSNAKTPVETYLINYQNLSPSVISDMEEVIKSEDLTIDEAEIYRSILEKQYSDLKYEIISEEYHGNDAEVKVKINVYDLYKATKEASAYLTTNVDKFYDDNHEYDSHKYLAYKLNKMKNTTDRVDYEITFNVVKENKTWKLKEITSDDLEKIHGIYNYEE